MLLAALESRIDDMVSELAQFHGYRTVWLGENGQLFHAEPEDMLELRGFTCIATMLRPTREELTAAALKIVTVELDEPLRRAMASWEAPISALESNLIPAM
ncbi:hypothetical protein DB30_00032 [Enhygromyxa salina]|uniref:Uncharacterized protein n=1 Tax=Enhygromyxa salina TaxID=215803 RepID=A0A0C2A7J0_9BACT|nr:hypothetical protein [Enhygromyxa salina]KIG19523.1 hypothetical protein DB30_00032 [Enhygromyxa salina]